MADTSTRPGADRRPLISYLKIQRDLDRQLIATLSRSTLRIEAELRRLANRPGIGAAVRRDQLASAQAAIHREIAALWRSLGFQILAAREEAAAVAAETMFPGTFLRQVMPAADVDYLLRSLRASASIGLDAVEDRLTLSKIDLSHRVYHSRDLVSGRIDEIVNAALARGASAAELAKDARRFIRPDTRGGIKYAAMRLGRTELNNAFHAGQVKSAIDMPWTTGLLWNLSGSHPRPDECNDYADDVHFEGGDAGVFKPEDCPGKPHPNCLCFTTAVTVSRRDFISAFQSGQYDDFVNQLAVSGGITIR